MKDILEGIDNFITGICGKNRRFFLEFFKVAKS